MMRLLVLLVLLAAPLSGQVAAIDSVMRVAAAAAVNGRLSTDAPGCAVGVRHRGQVIHRAGYGYADLEHRVPITSQSVFYTGSLSKQFTATAIGMLVRDGVLDPDAPVKRWIPELPDLASDITIRHLVHHTGGLREKWDLLAMQGVPTATTLVTQQMVLDLVAHQRGVLFPAGTRYAYSNTGYDLLATIIARATGQSIRQFAAARIFGPLSMTSARYGDRYGELIPQRAMGHVRDGAEWMRFPAMVETVGSGSVYASLDDLLAWVGSWETGVLGDSALQQMLETPGRLANGNAMTYAWGLVVDEWGGMRRVSHTGALAGYRTAIWRLPSERWATVVLCNSAEARPERVAAEVARITLGDRIESELSVASNAGGNANVTIPDPPAIPPELVGTYWSDELQVHWTITARDGGYWLSRGTVPDVQVTTSAVPDFPRTAASGALQLRIGGWRVQTLRGADGSVAELEVGAGVPRGVVFRRAR